MTSSTSSLPDWVLIDRYVFEDFFPADNPTEASCINSRGDEVRVCFQLREPPRPSRLYLSWPAGKCKTDRFFVVGAHRDALLFQMMYLIPVPRRELRHDMCDFFVYMAGDGSRGPLLERLPSLDGTMDEFRGLFEVGSYSYSNQQLRRLEALDIGVVRRDGDYALAELQIDRYEKIPAELHVLCSSRSRRWQVTHPEITIHDSCLKLETLLHDWRADKVVPIGNYLCWVDYCLGGILLCNVFDGSSDLQYLPFPAKFPDLNRNDAHELSWSYQFQNVCVNEDHGVLKFIMIVQGDGQMIGERFMAVSGFKVTSWTLKITDKNKLWVPDPVLKSDDLWKVDAFAQLPHTPLEFPVVSMADPSVVCFVLRDIGRVKIGYKYDETWLVALDMSNMAVVSSCHYINGKDENLSPEDAKFMKERYWLDDPFLPSELPKYLKANGASLLKQGQGSSHFDMVSDPRPPKRKFKAKILRCLIP